MGIIIVYSIIVIKKIVKVIFVAMVVFGLVASYVLTGF